jgi:hypothetical protein
MTTPGFTAEASLTKTMCKYRDSILLGREGPNAVLPMRGIPAALFGGHFPWEKQIHCCYEYEGVIRCDYPWVPIWYVCEDISPLGPSCLQCHPPDLFAPSAL